MDAYSPLMLTIATISSQVDRFEILNIRCHWQGE